MSDPIERQAAKEAYCKKFCHPGVLCPDSGFCREVDEAFDPVPSAQPEPLSDAYTKAVWTWLLDYQIKAAELKGRYTPYEVLSWVANDWRKEHE